MFLNQSNKFKVDKFRLSVQVEEKKRGGKICHFCCNQFAPSLSSVYQNLTPSPVKIL